MYVSLISDNQLLQSMQTLIHAIKENMEKLPIHSADSFSILSSLSQLLSFVCISQKCNLTLTEPTFRFAHMTGIQSNRQSGMVVSILFDLSSHSAQCFTRYELLSSLIFVTDRTDRQKTMHMSPPCNLHRWAQKPVRHAIENRKTRELSPREGDSS